MSDFDQIEAAVATDAAIAAVAAGGRNPETVAHAHGQCANCRTHLTGPYCSHCGQNAHELQRPWYHLVETLLESIWHFDSRGVRTMGLMLFRPGRLTRDYLEGRRASQVPPIRLYIFISLIFFLLLSASHIVFFQVVEVPEGTKAKAGAITTVRNGKEYVIRIFDRYVESKFEIPLIGPDTARVIGPDGKVTKGITLDPSANSKQTEKVLGAINDGLTDPAKVTESIAHWIPRLMILLVPVTALLLKVLYIRRRRYLIEHLVLSMHLHTLFFAVGIIFILLRWSTGWLPPPQFVAVLFLAYVVLMIRTVYQQNWFKTVLKTIVLKIAYIISMLLVISLLATIAFGGIVLF